MNAKQCRKRKKKRKRNRIQRFTVLNLLLGLSAGMLSALFSRYPFKAAVNLCYANTDFHGKTSRERKSDISLCLVKKNIKFALRYLAVDESFTVVALIKIRCENLQIKCLKWDAFGIKYHYNCALKK